MRNDTNVTSFDTCLEVYYKDAWFPWDLYHAFFPSSAPLGKVLWYFRLCVRLMELIHTRLFASYLLCHVPPF